MRFKVLRVKPTPTRFPTNSLYTPMDNTPLHSISSMCHPWVNPRCHVNESIFSHLLSVGCDPAGAKQTNLIILMLSSINDMICDLSKYRHNSSLSSTSVAPRFYLTVQD